ncbi:hypothetical protein MIZ03_2960 [Rhodoferax lithotrophicus]|uniref:Lipoprotein n=1 Tax=Rhodoferax lithotrophicus TaxID=2798804 RepID=A0ABN6D7Q5_9BURK|nr:hypothetical protein [uncultured Rhodoferax sp.]BCO28067.1 hypothetical protein MIZ03_2960 [Rhodoferax sp. MIZ03]
MNPTTWMMVITFTLCLTTGCSSEQLYAAGRNAQRTECLKQPDQERQSRCFKDAGISYDQYKRATESATQ